MFGLLLISIALNDGRAVEIHIYRWNRLNEWNLKRPTIPMISIPEKKIWFQNKSITIGNDVENGGSIQQLT